MLHLNVIMRIAYLLILLLGVFPGFSQTCPNPGQNASTAFPVCGTSVFIQNTVSICSGQLLPSPRCRQDQVGDTNPYWYKFTCFTAGTLGFLISPKDLNDDYDWEIYDVTGKNPNDVYTDGSLVISSNWSGEKGLTGASSAGRDIYVCGGPGKALYSQMVTLVVGHDYLLMVSHFTQSQSGYNLEFKGGTAIITDPAPPKLKKADAGCGGDKIRVSLSKKMKCSSISANGSEFTLTPSVGVNVVSVTGIGCSSRFDTDSLELVLDNALPPGNYSLVIKNGGDGNTIVDNCNVGIPVGEVLPLLIIPRAPTPMDSLVPVTCGPSELKLVFKKPMLCSSIAANGSDFSINGSYAVAVTAAAGTCNSGLSREILLKFDKPLQRKGNFVLTLKRGSDGNTVFDECNEETPVGSTLSFSVKDTVNADFSYEIFFGCQVDSVAFTHNGNNEVNVWDWDLDENLSASIRNPEVGYKQFTTKNVLLYVDNGFCADSSRQEVVLDNFLQADFDVPVDNCPLEPIPFTNNSKGKIADHEWSFDDGNAARTVSPSHTYSRPVRFKTYTVQYTVTDIYGCKSTDRKTINVYPSCIIDLPNAFTPNGDNINDVFYPLNAIKAEALDFKVYNRWGQLMFMSDNWKKGWNGRYKDVVQPGGIYVWTLRYTDRDTKKQLQRKGTVLLSN